MTHINGHRNGQVALGSRPDVTREARPEDLTHVDGKPVHKKLAEVFGEMKKAAAKDGVDLQIVSGYRSDAEQAKLYADYKAGRGNLAAPPGQSNHRTGLAVDIGPPSAYGWLAENAKKFGFAATVPSEAWHYELTGVTNGGSVSDNSSNFSGGSAGSGSGSAPSGDSNAVGGGGSPSGMSLGGGGSAGGAGGASSGGGSAGGAGSAGAASGASSSGPVGPMPEGDLKDWIEEAIKILEKMGIPRDKIDPAAIAAIIKHESGGDPRAVNNWDSNAAAGHPSKGLMQTIDSTFNQYKAPGHDDVFNPVDNIVAGVRYAISRYGSLSNVPGIKAMAGGGNYVGY